MALRSSGLFAKMILEADMQSLGIKNPVLNSGQIEALKQAQNPKNKAIVLVGPTGNEIAEIFFFCLR